MEVTTRIKRNTLGLRLDVRSLTTLDVIGIWLAVITGIIHFYLYWTTGFVPFLLAGVGFFGAVGLLLTTFPRWVLYLAGIPYTGIQVLLWVSFGMQPFTLGVFDKTAQVLLIGLLMALLTMEMEIEFLEWFASLFAEEDSRD